MNLEIYALLEKSNSSISAAELLNAQGYAEFGISRAYYAMFYIAEALLFNHGLSFSKHAAVIAAFGKEFSLSEKMDKKFH